MSAWGRVSAETDKASATLLRGVALLDDVFTLSFSAYHSMRLRGDEADDLAEAVEELAVTFDTLSDALKEAAKREADPETMASVIELLTPRRRAESVHQALHREEAG